MDLPGASAYFIAAGLAWLIAQAIKYLLNNTVTKRTWRTWYQSGSMPSSHTATMVALTVIVADKDGTGSGLFAVTTVVTLMTMYDAMMARRSAGEQGMALRKLLAKSPFAKDPLPYNALGHRPIEVAVGALLGTLVGLIVAILIT